MLVAYVNKVREWREPDLYPLYEYPGWVMHLRHELRENGTAPRLGTDWKPALATKDAARMLVADMLESLIPVIDGDLRDRIRRLVVAARQSTLALAMNEAGNGPFERQRDGDKWAEGAARAATVSLTGNTVTLVAFNVVVARGEYAAEQCDVSEWMKLYDTEVKAAWAFVSERANYYLLARTDTKEGQ